METVGKGSCGRHRKKQQRIRKWPNAAAVDEGAAVCEAGLLRMSFVPPGGWSAGLFRAVLAKRRRFFVLSYPAAARRSKVLATGIPPPSWRVEYVLVWSSSRPPPQLRACRGTTSHGLTSTHRQHAGHRPAREC